MGCFTVIHEYIRVLVLIERLSDAFHLSLKSFELFIAFNLEKMFKNNGALVFVLK